MKWVSSADFRTKVQPTLLMSTRPETYRPVVERNLYLQLYFAPPLGVIISEFRRYFCIIKLKSPLAIVQRCLRDPTFSPFGTTSACDRKTDRRTDGHSMTANTAQA